MVGGGEGKLMNNTLIALSSRSVRIRSVKNLKTGTELQAKNGSFQQQVDRLKSDPAHMNYLNKDSLTNVMDNR